MIQYDMIWLDIIWYDMILYTIRYCDIIWQNSTISLHTLLSCITQFLSRCRIHSNSKPPTPQTSKTMPDIFHTPHQKKMVLIGIHAPFIIFIWDLSRLLSPIFLKFPRWMASYLEREGLKPPTRLNRPQTAPAMRTSGAARGIGWPFFTGEQRNLLRQIWYDVARK